MTRTSIHVPSTTTTVSKGISTLAYGFQYTPSKSSQGKQYQTPMFSKSCKIPTWKKSAKNEPQVKNEPMLNSSSRQQQKNVKFSPKFLDNSELKNSKNGKEKKRVKIL